MSPCKSFISLFNRVTSPAALFNSWISRRSAFAEDRFVCNYNGKGFEQGASRQGPSQPGVRTASAAALTGFSLASRPATSLSRAGMSDSRTFLALRYKGWISRRSSWSFIWRMSSCSSLAFLAGARSISFVHYGQRAEVKEECHQVSSNSREEEISLRFVRMRRSPVRPSLGYSSCTAFELYRRRACACKTLAQSRLWRCS